MALVDVLRAVRRRWYVSLLVLAAVAAGTASIGTSGVYSTRTTVSFTFQDGSALAPYSGVSDDSVIAFAGAVVSDVNRGRAATKYSSTDAPYYGAGIREGALIALRDEGSQWMSVYNLAVIEIHIVGPGQEWVEEQQTRILEAVKQSTIAQQAALQVPSEHQIVAEVDPLTTRIVHITPSRSDKLMGYGALGVAALLAAGWTAVSVDSATARRRTDAVAEQLKRPENEP